MRILILTQKVDRSDPVLGFFHRWIEEFSKHCERVTVIALGVGEYDLPENVKVFSLGKSLGATRLAYVVNFYRIIWRERKNYDVVFVHMNQVYILLGGLLWKLIRKKITMWRNHPAGNLLTDIAVILSDKIFCTSKYSYTARYKKTSIMPVGIDIDFFIKDETIAKNKNSILLLGRISPIKNVDLFIDALNILDKEDVVFTAGIYGDSSVRDREYLKKIRIYAADLEKKGRVIFYGSVPNTRTPPIYNQYEFCVNATPSGSFDKTILEAMACECIVVSSNASLKSVVPKELLFKEGDASDLAKKLKEAILLLGNKKQEYGGIMRQCAEEHSLSVLSEKLFSLLVGIL